MSLASLPTQPSFDTSTHQLIKCFFEPALRAAIHYDRGVGFFTSNWLRMAASGLADFSIRGGTARFIVSPHMTAEDWAACRQGLDARTNDILIRALRAVTVDLPYSLEKRTLSALSWMIADKLLDIRIAMPTGALHGDFHDKFGVFRDHDDRMISFHGSPNDSAHAFRNYEAISAFYSWVDEREAQRVHAHQRRFNRLWTNKDPNVRVFCLPGAIRRNLVEFTNLLPSPYHTYQRPPAKAKDRWRHQHEATAAFLEKEHGVLEMATGTGKTRTAITILTELLLRDLVSTIVITMTGTDLLTQWYKTLIRYLDLGVYRQYGSFSEVSDFISAPEQKILLISRHHLSGVLPILPDSGLAKSIVICDEVHGLGSPSMVRDLSGQLQRSRFRLGLSATPEREYDEQGNRFIEREIGPVIFQFRLEDAIHRGILCEFDYTPLAYSLSDGDRVAIRQAFARFHARRAAGEGGAEEVLYRDIAFVRKTSEAKIEPFRRHVEDNPGLYRRCLIFVETARFGHAVQSILVKERIDYHTYYQSDDREVLERFGRGELDCLVSCHRLSEGIDIKSVENVVLFASARTQLETIQRLGRCLRVDDSNPEKRAHVLDFVDQASLQEDAVGYESDEIRCDRLLRLSRVRRQERR